MPYLRPSQFVPGHQIVFRGEIQAVLGSRKPLRIVPLWRHLDVNSAITVAEQAQSAYSKVVLAQLVSEAPLSDEMLDDLHDRHISVVPVPSRLAEAGADDDELRLVVERLLDEETRMLALEDATEPPQVDEAAALAIEKALKELKPMTQAQRQEFLDEFRGRENTDDGVR